MEREKEREKECESGVVIAPARQDNQNEQNVRNAQDGQNGNVRAARHEGGPHGGGESRGHALAGILGPAFVAAVAYVDPGNVAANITSGARYGYLLVWVLVLANVMSVFIQYQSAKLGVVTGKSLPELLGERMSDAGRFMFFMQAEVIAIATDLVSLWCDARSA